MKKIVRRWRRGHSPFQPGIPPRIVLRNSTHLPATDNVCKKYQYSGRHKDHATRSKHIQPLPVHIWTVGVNASRHAAQSQEMQGEESHVETDEKEPEVPFAQFLVRHPAHNFGEPEVNACEHWKQRPANEHIVKMRDHEIAIMHLQIHRHGRQHHSRKSTDQEHKKESEAPQHRQSKLKSSIPKRGHPAKELDSGRNHNHQARGCEKTLA